MIRFVVRVLCGAAALSVAGGVPRLRAQTSVPASPTMPSAARGAPSSARLLIARGTHPALRWGRLADFSAELSALYPDSAPTPTDWLWLRRGVPTPSAQALVAALGRLGDRGLDPRDYDATWLARQLDSARVAPLLDVERAAQVDVALSVAALRVSWGLRRGRVRPRDVHPTYRLRRPEFDVVSVVRRLATVTAVDSVFTALEPDYLHYQLTKAALARYRRLAAESLSRPLPPAPGTRQTVTAGMTWDGVPQLRRLLVAEGDLAADSVRPTERRYVPALVRAVTRYQRRNGLDADGDLGPTTRSALERPLTARIRALEFSLERWRWLPRLEEHRGGAPLVLVNIPAFRLYAFTGARDDEADLLMMNVVVGKAIENETPVFADTLSTIVFAPAWEVPPSIADKEIWPKAKADPTYLARNHYEVVNGSIRQRPGPWNALGRVKFLFPNDYAVYMHDTPSRRSFGRTRRDVSHGCIRLEDPRRFARWLLPDTTQYSNEWLDTALARDSSLTVRVPAPRPVLLIYATAMARQNGETEFYPDIYQHDVALAQRLAAGYPRAR